MPFQCYKEFCSVFLWLLRFKVCSQRAYNGVDGSWCPRWQVLKASETGEQEINVPVLWRPFPCSSCKSKCGAGHYTLIAPRDSRYRMFSFTFAIGKAVAQSCFPQGGGLGAILPFSCALNRPLQYHFSYWNQPLIKMWGQCRWQL